MATILVSNHVATQLITYRILMLLMLIYVAHVKAGWSHKLDLVHESLLLLQAVLLPLYTEYVDDPRIRHQIGWASAALFIL